MNIPTIELILFIKHIGLIICGAASLWGLYFFWASRKSDDIETAFSFQRISENLLIPFIAGSVLVLLSLLAFYMMPGMTFAHEGISLTPDLSDLMASINQFSFIFLIWFSLSFVALLFVLFRETVLHKKEKSRVFMNKLNWFYGIQFLIAAFLIGFYVWTGGFDKSQFFFFGHGVHSIFTLGTVIVLDFLFLLTDSIKTLKKAFYSKLKVISNVVWVGLGIDFLSVLIVFNDAIALTPKFWFMQAIIGILIVNGVFLSGYATDKLISFGKDDSVNTLSEKWNKALTASGSLSFGSWFSITFVDFFHGIDLSFVELFAGYIIFTIIVYFSYNVLEHYKEN